MSMKDSVLVNYNYNREYILLQRESFSVEEFVREDYCT